MLRWLEAPFIFIASGSLMCEEGCRAVHHGAATALVQGQGGVSRPTGRSALLGAGGTRRRRKRVYTCITSRTGAPQSRLLSWPAWHQNAESLYQVLFCL